MIAAMKNKFSSPLLVAAAAICGFMACKKTTNVFYPDGKTPTLSSSTTTIAATATDSLKNVISLTWTSPGYATDSATVLYTIQIDSTGRNFAKAVSMSVSGVLSDSITAK